MFQHTGQHIKRRPTCCPETEGVTPLLFELSAINGGVSTEKEIWWSYIRQQAWALAPWYDHHALLRVYAGVFYPYYRRVCGIRGALNMMPNKRNTLPMPCWSIGNNISSIPSSCLMPTLMQEQIFGACFAINHAEEMPILFYRTTFIPFDTYHYNFVTQQSE